MGEATDPAQIRRLMLDNVFVVFSKRDRERRMKSIRKSAVFVRRMTANAKPRLGHPYAE